MSWAPVTSRPAATVIRVFSSRPSASRATIEPPRAPSMTRARRQAGRADGGRRRRGNHRRGGGGGGRRDGRRRSRRECEDELQAPRRSTSPIAAARRVNLTGRVRPNHRLGMATPCQVVRRRGGQRAPAPQAATARTCARPGERLRRQGRCRRGPWRRLRHDAPRPRRNRPRSHGSW